MLNALKLIPRRQEIFVHNSVEANLNGVHCARAKSFTRFVLVENIMGRFGPSVMKYGLELDFTSKAAELRVFGQLGSIVLETYCIMSAAILTLVVLVARMMYL